MSSPSSGGQNSDALDGAPAADPPSTAPTRAGARPALPRLPYRRLGRLVRYPTLSSAFAALALGGCAVLVLHLVQRQTGTVGLLVGIGLALLPVPFVLGALAWLNQIARVPMRHTLFCLAWGAFAATTVAITVNGWVSGFLTAHQGSLGETLGADFTTPLIEEIAKGAALLVLLIPLRHRLRCRAEHRCTALARFVPDQAALRRPHGSHPGRPSAYRLRRHLRPLPYFRQPVRASTGKRARSSPRTLTAGVVLGGVTACGFAFTENTLYLGRAFSDDQQARQDSIGLGAAPSLRDYDDTVHTFLLRGLLSPFAHPLFTALTGLGIALTLTTGRRWLARLAGPVGLLLAMTLHGAWNAAAGLGTHGFLLIYGLVMVPCFVALVCFAAWARARTGRLGGRHPPG